MALHAVITVGELDRGAILAPERYDPRRRSHRQQGVTIADLVDLIHCTIAPDREGDPRPVVVINTGDASEGLIVSTQHPLPRTAIGSAKKMIAVGDVIISRLRPYLRQVAFVDTGVVPEKSEDTILACSTEFYVLRGKTQQHISFLVPFLLTSGVQEILRASQEGGHHPRFGQAALERIEIPDGLLALRDALSGAVEAAVETARAAHTSMRDLVATCEQPCGERQGDDNCVMDGYSTSTRM